MQAKPLISQMVKWKCSRESKLTVDFICRGNKTKRNRQFRKHVLGTTAPGSLSSTDLPEVTWLDCQAAIISLQLHSGCTVRLCPGSEQMAEYIITLTKAVSERPFRWAVPQTIISSKVPLLIFSERRVILVSTQMLPAETRKGYVHDMYLPYSTKCSRCTIFTYWQHWTFRGNNFHNRGFPVACQKCLRFKSNPWKTKMLLKSLKFSAVVILWLYRTCILLSVTQVESGTQLATTWKNQLMQFNNFSEPMASAVVAEYPTPAHLISVRWSVLLHVSVLLHTSKTDLIVTTDGFFTCRPIHCVMKGHCFCKI